MTQRKTVLSCLLSVAFLIPARLSFVPAMEAPGPDGLRAEARGVGWPRENCRGQRNLLNPDGSQGLTMNCKRHDALKPMR
jgi:hypothetical protein